MAVLTLAALAALLGGLCWAGSRRIYSDQYIADDVDLYCDDGCSSDDYQDSAPATESRDD